VEGIGSVDNPFEPPDGVYIEFANDTVIIDYDRPTTPDVTLVLQFGDNVVTRINYGGIGGPDPGVSGNTYTIDAAALGFFAIFDAVDDDVTDYTYRIILK